MRITHLGHAGFCVETSEAILIADPWLSPDGAFDAAWFQFPRNHHLGAFVQEKLKQTRKARYIYISHEHKDHFDLSFLHSLQCRDFTFILPRFRRTALLDALEGYRCQSIITCADKESVTIPGGTVTLYLDDSELNRDSSVLIKADGLSFLNMNDCKLHDELPAIAAAQGSIDILAAQFSGATWHPTCYDYPRKTYERISRKKMISKFEATAQAIETIRPRVFLPSAGPACFLDPLLLHLNFEPVNIFPRAPRLIAYLKRRFKGGLPCACQEIMPGDLLDAASGQFLYLAPERVDDANFAAYIKAYAAQYESFFLERQRLYEKPAGEPPLERLQAALAEKLDLLTLRDRVTVPLYFQLSDSEGPLLRVDFAGNKVEQVAAITEESRYVIAAPSWEVARVLDGLLTWEDFALTFRMRLDREPDVYQTVLQGYLLMEPEDMNWFCAKVLAVEQQQERIVVEARGCRFAVNRFCPHQGADLTSGWVEKERYLVCPRHRWQFDLEKDGRCTTNETSIHAVPLEEG